MTLLAASGLNASLGSRKVLHDTAASLYGIAFLRDNVSAPSEHSASHGEPSWNPRRLRKPGQTLFFRGLSS